VPGKIVEEGKSSHSNAFRGVLSKFPKAAVIDGDDKSTPVVMAYIRSSSV
jgi:hypothetical protein